MVLSSYLPNWLHTRLTLFYALFVGAFCLSETLPAYSWNALGHRLIAQIAYDNMTPEARIFCANLNRALDKKYGRHDWVYAASWLDSLRDEKYAWLKQKHYINLPFSRPNDPAAQCPTSLPNKDNAVTTIQDTRKYLEQSPLNCHESNTFNRAFYFRIFVHVVGDLHQPLHTATLVAREYPKGDQGGNLFLLGHNSVGSNLHAYWDHGGGTLLTHRPVHLSKLKKKARQIEQRWPCDTSTADLNPVHWAQESFALAKKYAYQINARQKPSRSYQIMVKEITKQRIALAGCRLAALLNQLEKKCD